MEDASGSWRLSSLAGEAASACEEPCAQRRRRTQEETRGKESSRVSELGFVVLSQPNPIGNTLEAGPGQKNSIRAELFGREAHMSAHGEMAEICFFWPKIKTQVQARCRGGTMGESGEACW